MRNPNKQDMRSVTFAGLDGWCFGVEFFIQAALFERTGYADWEIERSHDTVKIRRLSMTSYSKGIEIGRTYIAFKPAKFELRDDIYSWHRVWAAAVNLVDSLERVPPRENG